MAYPGNAALSPEVQQRLQDTFSQTLGLAEAGKRQEAILGCEFILQLDADYAPARTLLERLRGAGAVDVEDLRGNGADAPGFVDEGFGVELPPLDDGDAGGGLGGLAGDLGGG